MTRCLGIDFIQELEWPEEGASLKSKLSWLAHIMLTSELNCNIFHSLPLCTLSSQAVTSIKTALVPTSELPQSPVCSHKLYIRNPDCLFSQFLVSYSFCSAIFIIALGFQANCHCMSALNLVWCKQMPVNWSCGCFLGRTARKAAPHNPGMWVWPPQGAFFRTCVL